MSSGAGTDVEAGGFPGEASFDLLARRVVVPRANGFEALSLIGYAGMLMSWAGALHGPMTVTAATALTVLTLAALFVPATLFVVFPRRTSGMLSLTAADVAWNGKRVVARHQVHEAIAYRNVDASGPRYGVRLSAGLRRWFFEVGSPEEAGRVVDAFGLEGPRATTTFAQDLGLLNVSNLVAIAVIGTMHTFGMIVLSTAVLLLVAGLFGWRRWTVMRGGIALRPLLGRTRLVPFADVESVTASHGKLVVTLRQGPPLSMQLPNEERVRKWPSVGAHAYATRIERARAHAASLATGDSLAPLLARGGRNLAAWTRALAALDDAAGTLRGPAVPRERLWHAVEDSAEPSDVRAAAAGVLRRNLRDDERARLRLAAASCAVPHLRVALDAAQVREEAPFLEALDAVDARVARRRA